jgi:TolB-like protein/Tfp pilus assembly protein PilF
MIWVFRPPAENSIAILPFDNLGDPAEIYWVDGFTDEITNRLARVPELKVAARTSAYVFRDSDEDARTIARKLGVAYLLDGSLRKVGDEVTVSVNLVDPEGFVIWSNSYSVNTNDVSALQDDILNVVLRHVFHDADPPPTVDTDLPTRNIDAYDLVLQGRYHVARRGEDSLRLSISLFQEAISLDESYADAYVGLATAYAVLPIYSREAAEGSFDLATAILEKGAQMNPNVDVLGASVIAFIHYHTEWEWIEAENAFNKALRYTPNDSDLLNWYSVFLAGVGRIDESLEVAVRARDLDRLSPVVNQRLAVAHLWAGNNDMANEYFEIANELGMAPATQPEAYVILLMRQGEYALALQLLSLQQMMMGYDDAWVEALFVAMQDSQYRADAVEVVLRAEQNGDITPLHLFGVWVYLEEEDRAVDAALALIRDRVSFNSEFLFAAESAALRQHPRFGEIIRGIRLDAYWDYFGWPPMCEPQGADIVCH